MSLVSLRVVLSCDAMSASEGGSSIRNGGGGFAPFSFSEPQLWQAIKTEDAKAQAWGRYWYVLIPALMVFDDARVAQHHIRLSSSHGRSSAIVSAERD